MKKKIFIISGLVLATALVVRVAFWLPHANRGFLQERLDLEFEGVIIKKFERRGTRLLLDHYGRTFEAEGILNSEVSLGSSIGDTLIKLKGNKCILKRRGRVDTLQYLYLDGY